MASSEDGDLIDLGNEDVCVPRVPFTETLPEQEHLLDVCPPKLEETLSLTRKQEQMQNVNDSSDVLVTLGHDKVVPIRKRIDVVSSDTIKRVRDITRNLEPVIRKTRSETNKEHHDTVDHGSATSRNLKNDDCPISDRATDRASDKASDEACDKTSEGHEDETFEAQEISNAFDFLAEHEDVELDQLDELDPEYDRCDTLEDPPLLTGHSTRSGPENEDLLSCHRASSTMFNRKPPDKYFLRDNFHIAEKNKPTFELSSGDTALKSISCADSVDREFELKLELELETSGGVAIVKKRYENGSFGRTVGRSCFQRAHRKSWTERGSPKNGSKDAFLRFDRSTSLRDYNSEPSASKAVRRQSSFVSRFSVDEDLDEEDTNPQDGCSECSEVDWSWLEEVECPRAADPSLTLVAVLDNTEHHRGGSASPTRETTRRKRGCEHRATDAGCSAAMSVSGTAKCPVVGDLGWSITSDQLPADPVEAEIDRDEAPCCNASSASNASNASNTSNETVRDNNPATLVNSWLRASMRRLRHLRLPDGFERQHGSNDSSNRRGFGVNTIASASATAPVISSTTASAPNSLPDIALIAPEILAAQTNGTSGTLLRPSSAPVRTVNSSSAVPLRRGGRQLRGSRLQAGRDCREPSSRQSSVLSTTTGTDTTASGTTTCSSSFGDASTSPPSSTVTSPQRVASRRICERQRDVDRDGDRREDEDEDANPLGKWPHALSPALACLSCTLGLFNISRFSILSIQFGANFIVQFLILSFVLGIPLLTLHVCLGQRLAAGSVDMWKISPLFQGVGIALLTAQAFIGIYSIVGVSWMFVYFRDSFITKQDKYRWAEPFSLYRIDKPVQNASTLYKLYETVPDYFSGVVLQRHHLNESDPGVVTLKFQVAFNLAVVWMIVFVSLSKGLRSYGKVVYVFTLIPVFGTLLLCTKLLGLTPPGSIHQLFPVTVGTEFFVNGKSWVAASVEVFLTWGLLGAAAMQIAAHNKHKHLLQRDTSLVILLTIVVLLLAAFLANTCVQILKHHGYVYIPSSFERISSYVFLRPANQPAPPGYSSTPERFMAHASFIVGERVTRPGADFSESGYQALRLSTELVPAMLALLGTEQVSPFWAVLFYFVLILFGIAQQLAIWHCVITGIMAINTKMMKLWETTITFFSCACGYILGLPMATELGIHVVYYLDYTIGGSWWIMILYLVQVGAVFAVRGRPHSGEAVVAELFPPTGRCLRHWAGPLLSFTWNVVLPVILMVLGITVFKNAGFRELYSYRRTTKDYWSVWARQLGAAIQLIPILTIPAVAIIQTCRYLNSGPPDIFDRIQLLYRPSLETDDPRDGQTHIGTETSTSIHGNGIVSASTEVPFEDPPPKYTPPPSYTTATGARIAKMLRQSFRRSVRRIANVLGESSAPRQRPALQPPPPDYATVLVEMNQGRQRQDVTIHVSERRIENGDGDVDGDGEGDCDGDGDGDEGGGDDGSGNGRAASIRSNILDRNTNRPNTIDRAMRIGSRTASAVGYSVERLHSTLERNRTRPSTIGSSSSSNLTAVDVANLLRSSIRRGTARTQQSLRRSFCHDEPTAAASVENLVDAAAPIGEESLVIPKDMSLVSSDQQANVDSNDKKTAVETDNSVSVI